MGSSIPIHAWTAAVEHPSHLYWLAKQIDGHRGEGTWPIFAARAQTFFGLRRRQFFYEPLGDFGTILRGADFIGRANEASVALPYQDHVMIVFKIFSGAYGASHGDILPPTRAESFRGFHAVSVAGWAEGGDRLIIRNSWGRYWGQDGYGTVGRDCLDAYMTEAWLQRNARYGLSRYSWKRFQLATSPSEMRIAFLSENSRWRYPLRYAGRQYEFVLYETISLQDSCPVEIIELKNRAGIRLAWCEVFHMRSSTDAQPRSVIKELFVWPQFRRRGYGTLIEAAATFRSSAAGSEVVEILFHEADARPQVRAAGRFLHRHVIIGGDGKKASDRRLPAWRNGRRAMRERLQYLSSLIAGTWAEAVELTGKVSWSRGWLYL